MIARLLLLLALLIAGPLHAADPCAIAGQCAPPLPTIYTEAQNPSRITMFREQHRGGRYEREQHKQLILGATVLKFSTHDIAGGGKLLPLQVGVHDMLVDSVAAGSVTVTGTTTVAQFVMNEADHKPGWRRVQVREPDGKLSPTWFVHVGTQTADRVVPVATSVFDWTHGAGYTHRWTWVPADAKPAAYRIPLRDWPTFSTALAGKDLYLSTLIPDTGSHLVDQYPPFSTFGKQAYYYSDFVRLLPVLPLLDGPAGIGTLPMPTHIEMGRATLTADPSSRPVRAAYVLNPWALARVNEDGSKHTLVGWRGWPGALELVGNWSAIPADRRGLHEAWSFRFDPATLVLDLSAPLINGRPPHSGSPTGYLADTQNNRVLKVVFDGRSHETPAVVTEHITGLGDPFGLAIWRDELIVSERLAQRIAAYDLTTGAFKRVVLQCDGTHYAMGLDREPVRKPLAADEAAALAKRREAPCVAPEGMDLDGDELVFGSVAQAQVRRLHLVTGALRVQGNVPVDAGANFVQLAVTDGVGPAGTVFAATWSGTQFGYPIAILPDGKRWLYMSNAQGAPSMGRGSLWASFGYSAAVGVRAGRLVFGSAGFGLAQIGRALPTDPVVDLKKYAAGRLELDPLLFGEGGHSPYGYEVPRAANADYYLQVHGQR